MHQLRHQFTKDEVSSLLPVGEVSCRARTRLQHLCGPCLRHEGLLGNILHLSSFQMTAAPAESLTDPEAEPPPNQLPHS